MPIYEYECTQCGRIEEAIQKFSDAPLDRCRHCSGSLHKMISQSAFHLKGTGWYVTDYAGKKTGAGTNTSTSTSKNEGNTTSEPEKSESPSD